MSYSIEAYLTGLDDAERDIADGRLAIEIFVAPWSLDGGASILKETYGIETKIVGSDLVFPGEREHAEGYNELMRAEIERRFGAGVLERAAAEAEANWKPEPPMSNWHALWAIPLFVLVLLVSAVLWPAPHLVAWIRRKRGIRYSLGTKQPIRHWYDDLFALIGGVFDRFLS
jgi:hypothetical protein